MIKQLLLLTEHSLEASDKLNTLDRLDDSLVAMTMFDGDDVSTESSALLRAIGIQGNRSLDKETLIRNLDKIQTEVAKDLIFKGGDVGNAISEISDYTVRTHIDLNKRLLTVDNKTVSYKVELFNVQTITVSDKISSVKEFIAHASRFDVVFRLVTDPLYSSIRELVNSSLEKPDKGYGTSVLSNLKTPSNHLNNSTLSYSRNNLVGWKFRFDVRRTGSQSSIVWDIGHAEQLDLKNLLGEFSESIKEANGKVSKILSEYNVDKKLNKGNLELVYKFYVPLILTHSKISYLISDVLKEYLEN